MEPSPENQGAIPRRDFLVKSAVTLGAVGGIGAAGPDPRGPEGASARSEPGPANLPAARGAAAAPAAAGTGRYNGPYAGERLNRIAFPLGGMGAGMLCLEGTGALSHFSLRNKPEVFNEPCTFAAVSIRGEPELARVLEGPVPSWKLFGTPGSGNGAAGTSFGFPRFRRATFQARFPFATVALSDEAVPLSVEVTGWSPFEPGDADNSSLPAAVLEYRFTNTGPRPVDAMFSFSAKNFLAAGRGEQAVRALPKAFVLWSAGAKEKPWEEGSFCAMVNDPETKVNCSWFRGGWWDALTLAWKDVREAAAYDRSPVTDGKPSPGATLFVPLRLAPRASRTVPLLLSWYVGQTDLRIGKDPAPAGKADAEPPRKHRPWYAGRFADLNAVSAYLRDHYQELRGKAERFSLCFQDTTLPGEVIEAVAANLTILKSPTVMRQEDGKLWCWEGCSDNSGCCHGSCTHVWNYAQALPHLFPDLERTLRETEFGPSQDDSGHQMFRSALPIRPLVHDFHAAADGQLGGIMKVHRDWRISGDTEWLRRLWPRVKKSLDYCVETWDPGHKGVVEEPHHNTYDIEFWGPDGMCTSFYLGALRAAVNMGRALSEEVSLYDSLLAKGTRIAESDLFNGEYFIQKIQWTGLRSKSPLEMQSMVGDYSPEAVDIFKKEGPKYQYGTGCLSDGVLGSWMALACGAGQVLDREKVKSHLRSIHRYNLKKDLSAHVNPQRPSYAAGTDGGLLLCTWPKGGELSLPFVYSNEVWTGIEYQVASHLMMLGLVEEGLEVVRAARDRYDGRVRNPFNEYECGHWYARAMSSYALLQGLSGARYDAVDKVLHLEPPARGDFRAFLSAATGYGTVGVKDGKPFLEVKSGKIEVKEIRYSPPA
jgi:uncharacterized protein (DUF608 family)